MIVVFGPAELSDAVAAVFAGELVIGAREEARLAGEPGPAVAAAAALPIPARLCVVTAERSPTELCGAVAHAGGALEGARSVVVGAPPPGTTAAAWREFLERLQAVPVADVVELAARLPAPTTAAGRGVPGASPAMVREAAVWRDTLRVRGRRRGGSSTRGSDRRIGEEQLDAVIGRRLESHCHTVAVISPKGGVGKTLLSFLLGSVLAAVRRDRVAVVDANPDFGSLADLVPQRVPAHIGTLLDVLPQVTSREQLDTMVTPTGTGMDILAAPLDPAEMSRLGGGGYAAVDELLRRHYDLVVYDCGTGFLDEVTQFALRSADQVVLVCAPQLVTTKVILGAIAHLEETRFDLRRSTLALNMTGRGGGDLDLDRLYAALDGRVGGVVEVPHDERLQRDLDLGEFSYGRLRGRTRLALKRLAAEAVGRIPVGVIVPAAGGSGGGGVLSTARRR
jgi:MinD-like ATPase involved in chromosome partitioning or flagellar assembly